MIRALHRKLWRDLAHLRGPLAATALVAASGVALFVSLRSMHGFLIEAQARTYEEGRFAQVFAHLRQAPDALGERIRAIAGVAAVEPRVAADVLLDVPGLPEPATGRLVGVPEEGRPILNRPHLLRGEWREPRQAAQVVASEAFARANGLAPGDDIGAVIGGRWQRLRVVGTAVSPEFIYEIGGGGQIFPDNRRFGVLWAGEDALATAFGMRGSFNDVGVTLVPGASEPDVIAHLDALLAPYGGLGAHGRSDQISHRFVTDEIAETRVTSILIPSIFLAVTAFLIHLVLSRLVGTQREQLAVLKAFGYDNAAVGAHVVLLGLIPVLAGGLVGAGAGLGLASRLAVIYARFFQFPSSSYRPDFGIAAAALAIAAGAALAGSLSAVRAVLALEPAEAMRPEAPASFRRLLIDRVWIGGRLSPAAKIVARHLERQPARASLSVLGIALAVAIVVAGRYAYDAIDRLKRVQFDHAMRDDVCLGFREVSGPGAASGLARLPGVIRVEPFRAVAARLRSVARGDRVEKVALTGLDPAGMLRRVVDGEFVPHAIPPEGLLLTSKLAEMLDVRPGDAVVVEVLEGERPVRRVRVAALADELIGTNATMGLGALRRLLREGPTASGAFLTIDPASAEALYLRLKRLPAVATVGVHQAIVGGFERTIAESFLISISITMGFACVIAFGMVYNGARVALSERGRELASLRVLGFARREVASMLLGEQAALTLLAIPVGLGIGYGLCALMAWRFASELFRLPLVVSATTLAFSTAVVVVAAILSAIAVRRRIDRLDMIEVLKSRE